MGVDCKVILPHNARIEDVADVMGALAGLKPTRRDFGKPSDGWSCHVEGVECKTSHTPVMAIINLRATAEEKLVDGQQTHFCYYHFESKHGRLVSMRSTDFWISIAKGLVDFFGGAADFSEQARERAAAKIEKAFPLRGDNYRINWLESKKYFQVGINSRNGRWVYEIRFNESGQLKRFFGGSLRSAIDSGMDSEGK